MRGYFFPTDKKWFDFLRARQESAPGGHLEEVNFWRPTATRFKALAPGEPFFFKLKAPHDCIGGFGYFARYSPARISVAWEAFAELNGAPTLDEWKRSLASLRRGADPGSDQGSGDFEVGCIMISAPVFFPRELWIPEPSDFPSNSPTGKTYGVDVGEAADIFRRCREAVALMNLAAPTDANDDRVGEEHGKFGTPIVVRPRIGQGTFRVGVVDAYGRACAVTNEHSLPVLEAAHIKPYAGQGTHSLDNGLLLRVDVHRLFDLGYVTVDPDYRFVISSRLKQDYGNGEAYKRFAGQQINVPQSPNERPSVEALRWHNEERFLG